MTAFKQGAPRQRERPHAAHAWQRRWLAEPGVGGLWRSQQRRLSQGVTARRLRIVQIRTKELHLHVDPGTGRLLRFHLDRWGDPDDSGTWGPVPFGGDVTGWSSFDELALQLPADQKIVANRDWRNTIALRVGTEYTYQKRWSGRLGLIWDQGPVPTKTLDFQLPDVNRVDLTVGAGAAFSKAVRADIAALYVLPGKATTSKADPYQPPVKGEYRVHAWVLSLSVGVTFDVARTPEPQLD